MKLTYILLDLMEQQSARKRELLDTLGRLESQRENEQRDFWLLQYQKLLDAQPGEQSFRATSIDPMLGYQFLLNGVVHCIPFLSRLWQSEKYNNIMDITDADLIEAGIKNASDREKILQSISDFLKLEKPSQIKEAIPIAQSHAHAPATATAQKHPDTPPSAPQAEQSQSNQNQMEAAGELESECVICMEEPVSGPTFFIEDVSLKNVILIAAKFISVILFFPKYFFQCKIIFLPCGHLCCCLNCHKTIEICPMCRSTIDCRIKIIKA